MKKVIHTIPLNTIDITECEVYKLYAFNPTETHGEEYNSTIVCLANVSTSNQYHWVNFGSRRIWDNNGHDNLSDALKNKKDFNVYQFDNITELIKWASQINFN